MPKVFDYSGNDDFCSGRSIYANPKELGLFLSLGHQVDAYLPPRKRSCISAPFIFSGERSQQVKKSSIDVLPDECLFEIFRRLPGGEERSTCACVSKRWLMLLSSICRDEICSSKISQSPDHKEIVVSKHVDEPSQLNKKEIPAPPKGEKVEAEAEELEIEGDGYLSRCLEGKKATDFRLAAIAVGTYSRGGLGKLSIRGSNFNRGVTNLGLQAIARGCPSLRTLSLWNIPSVGDEGLIEISNGCHRLEKLDLCRCPGISDKALVSLARNCPNLTSLTIESCSSIGNEGLQAVGSYCPNLTSISIKNCMLVGDNGVASLLASCSYVLTKVKLQGLNISDVSLAVIGHYGKAITDLALTGLPNVSEKGFWVMGNGQGLQKLRSFAIASCPGVTDLGVEAVAKGCPNLKQFCLRRCAFLSDNGLVSFAKSVVSLESLQLEECHRITQSGLFGAIVNCCGKLKNITLENCLGIKDASLGFRLMSPCSSLKSVAIRNCPGFGNASLSLLGRLCPHLQHVEFVGLSGITDAGFLSLIHNCEAGLIKVNLGGCVNLTDKLVSAIARVHGGTLDLVNLEGCVYVTDASVMAIVENCSVLSELDVSRCSVTDSGIAALAHAVQFNLQVLSLSGCSLVSNKSLPSLEKLGKTLVGLNIQHCRGISTYTVDLLMEHLLKCDILA